ncbi:hypothetical protein BGZ60DRAFT_566536 [Tricladium varicosporioides]|nr:hypothetical protein BGZ60DRAFT_566536 [Hymenoscyphus varicosporioides]
MSTTDTNIAISFGVISTIVGLSTLGMKCLKRIRPGQPPGNPLAQKDLEQGNEEPHRHQHIHLIMISASLGQHGVGNVWLLEETVELEHL